MKVALFLEGSPGHEKQSLAIIQALKKRLDVHVTEIHLPEKTRLQRAYDIISLSWPKSGNSTYDIGECDLAIGTGSRTHAALLACKKKSRVPIVTCMSPDIWFRNSFDLCFIPRHDQVAERDNVFLTDGPPVLSAESNLVREPGKGLILLGGIDESSHFWRGAEIIGFIRNIVNESETLEWAISSSPRTPAETVDLIRDFSGSRENVKFYDYRDTPRGWVEEQYAKSSVAWVTADSISMVYEALTAGCKVGILPVRWKNTKNKFQRSLDNLLAKGLIKVYSPAEPISLASIPEHIFNEADRCAEEIIRRFGSR